MSSPSVYIRGAAKFSGIQKPNRPKVHTDITAQSTFKSYGTSSRYDLSSLRYKPPQITRSFHFFIT